MNLHITNPINNRMFN